MAEFIVNMFYLLFFLGGLIGGGLASYLVSR